MNLCETKVGQCFFDEQLPKLIKALEKIASSLSDMQPAVKLPVDIPDNYLEELYYGNLNLGANADERYENQGMKEIISLQEDLMDQLTPEQWELFQKFNVALNKHNLDETCRMFQHGYRLAVHLLAAGLQTPKSGDEQ